MNPNDRLATALEVARYLAISPRKLWQLTHTGEIKATVVPPRSVRYDPKQVQDFIDRCTGQRSDDDQVEDDRVEDDR